MKLLSPPYSLSLSQIHDMVHENKTANPKWGFENSPSHSWFILDLGTTLISITKPHSHLCKQMLGFQILKSPKVIILITKIK